MNLRLAACALALAAASGATMAAQHPFNAHDLAMMDRVSDPHLSPNCSEVAFSVRSTDWDTNKGVNSVWLLDLSHKGVEPRRVTDLKLNANSPAFSPDGKTLYFLATENDSTQLWSAPVAGGAPVQVTHLPLDVDNFKLSPDGKSLLFSAQMFEDCTTLECTRQKLDAKKNDKATGRLYHRLFVRHWDEWSDHRRGQLFVMPLDGSSKPVLLTVASMATCLRNPTAAMPSTRGRPTAVRCISTCASRARPNLGPPISTCIRFRLTVPPRRRT